MKGNRRDPTQIVWRGKDQRVIISNGRIALVEMEGKDQVVQNGTVLQVIDLLHTAAIEIEIALGVQDNEVAGNGIKLLKESMIELQDEKEQVLGVL
jgi:hypothetical protein